MTITRTRRLAALAAIAALALAGCGGSSAEDDANKQIEAANSQVAAAASSAQEAANQAASQAQAAASQIAGAASSMVDQAQSQADAAASSAEAEMSAAMSDATAIAGDTAASDPAAGDTALADDTTAGDTAAEAAVVGPYEKGGFAAIVKQLEGELGYSPQVLQVVLSADFAQFQVRDRKKPKNVDQYEWRDGAFSDPVPVKLVGDGDLGANVFPLKVLVAKPDVPVKLHAAGEALSIDEPEVSTMIAQRMLPFSTDVRWLVNVGGSREDKQLRATPGGKVVEVV